MDEGGDDVSGTEPFLEQALNEMVLLGKCPSLQRDAQFAEEHIGARRFHFIGGGDFGPLNAHVGIAFNIADLK